MPEGEPVRVEGNTLLGLIPFGIESRDLGGWSEQLAPTCLSNAVTDDLIATVNHDVSRILGRFPTTLRIEQRSDGLAWECDLPNGPTGQDVREAVRRGDLKATSWRMVVGKDRWDGTRRTVEEIRELRDVSIVANPSYRTTAELRSQPQPHVSPVAPVTEPEEADVPDQTPAGGLTIEDRAATDDQPTVEQRVLDVLRGVPKGEARDLSTATVANVSPPELSDYLFQKLRPTSVALRSGIATLSTMRESIQWPMLTTDITPGFVAEGTQIPETDPGFATLTATPRKIAARTVVNNEVIDDSDPSITDALTAHLGTLIALKLDLAIYQGDGTNNSIVGLRNIAGLQTISMGTNGSAFTNLDPFAQAIGQLQTANAPGPYAIVMHPSTWQALSMLKEGTGYNRPLLEQFPVNAPQPSIYGCPVYVSSQISVADTQGTTTTATSAYVYAPSQVVLVRRQDFSAQLDRSRLFDMDQSEMRGTLRADLLVPNPSAVVRIVGIKTS